jgi:hypothetical protein
MNTTRTLALAAVAALSLGMGAAMAQENPEFAVPNDYWAVRAASQTAPANVTHAVRTEMPQAGSADRPAATPYLGVPDFSTSGSE